MCDVCECADDLRRKKKVDITVQNVQKKKKKNLDIWPVLGNRVGRYADVWKLSDRVRIFRWKPSNRFRGQM